MRARIRPRVSGKTYLWPTGTGDYPMDIALYKALRRHGWSFWVAPYDSGDTLKMRKEGYGTYLLTRPPKEETPPGWSGVIEDIASDIALAMSCAQHDLPLMLAGLADWQHVARDIITIRLETSA